MVLIDAGAGLLLTSAPGTASTALRAAWLQQRDVREVPPPGAVRTAGVDVKHGTVGQLVAAGLLPVDHGLRVVTTTRNPFDYYLAEYERTRTRWVLELDDPGSWVHATPGAVDRIAEAVTMDFDAWLTRAIGSPPRPRRVNAGHVAEADVVLRMEHLEGDLRDLCGLRLTVPRTNVTARERAWWRVYDVAGRSLVESAHAEDLRRFGYTF